MTNASRRKGLAGEQAVARVYREAGFTVRRLSGLGDLHALRAGCAPQHVESKNQARLQLPIWLRQAKREAPAGYVPVVVFPDGAGELWACLPLDRLVASLT